MKKSGKGSIRLKGYDYSKAGDYLITLVANNRDQLFGEIKDGKMILNDAGEMIKKWYFELENKFEDLKCDSFMVMPDHFHAIIKLLTRSVRHAGLSQQAGLTQQAGSFSRGEIGSKQFLNWEPSEKITSLPRVIQWFKTMTTNEYIRYVKTGEYIPFYKKLWQRNYYEHIIRNKNELEGLRKYILNNPATWQKDKENEFNENIFQENSNKKVENTAGESDIGNVSLLRLSKLALFSSVKCPGKIILETYDLMQKLKNGETAFLSGFHSPMEKECLNILLRGTAPIILCPARSLKKFRVLKEYKKAIEAERMLIISPFPDSMTRNTRENAEKRNKFIAEISDEILIAYAATGSKTEKLAKEILKMGKPVFTFNTKYNENLLGMGVQIINKVK